MCQTHYFYLIGPLLFLKTFVLLKQHNYFSNETAVSLKQDPIVLKSAGPFSGPPGCEGYVSKHVCLLIVPVCNFCDFVALYTVTAL